MANKKATVKQNEAAAIKAEVKPADVTTEVKPTAKTDAKSTAKAEVKPTAKAEVKPSAKTASKTAEVKSEPAPKTGKGKQTVQNLYIQHNDVDFEYKDIFRRVKENWIALGNKESDIVSINVYVVPSHMRVYYVINEEAKDEYSFDL